MVTLSIARFLFWLWCSVQNYNGTETDTFVYDYINPTSNKASALLRSVTYNGVTTSYTYDNLDRLTSVTTNNETTSYSYNSNNELITSLSDNRQYYYSGNRITLITLEDNPIINFTYDYLGRRLLIKINKKYLEKIFLIKCIKVLTHLYFLEIRFILMAKRQIPSSMIILIQQGKKLLPY